MTAWRSLIRPVPKTILALVLVFAFVFAFAACAYAAPAITNPKPAPNSVGWAPGSRIIAVHASDPVGLKSTAQVAVDGVWTTTNLAYLAIEDEETEEFLGWDTTQGDVSCVRMLTNGVHTLSVKVTNNQNVSTTYSWSITVGSALATVDTLSPVNGSYLSTRAPLLSARVSGGTTVMRLDGAIVPATVASGIASYQCPTLADDSQHTFSVTVTAAGGGSSTASSGFYIHTGAPAFSALSPLDSDTASAHLSARVVDTIPISTTMLSVDGVPITSSFGVLNPADGIVTGLSGPLTDGVHTAAVTASNAAFSTSSTSWEFTVAAPPEISGVSPAASTVEVDLTPTLSVSATDNSPGPLSGTFTIGGQSAPGTWAQGSLSATVPDALAAGTYEVACELTDAAGNTATKAWTIRVQSREPMPTAAQCTTCHVGYPASHPTGVCASCHTDGEGASHVGVNDSTAHPGAPCTWCHDEAAYPQVDNHPLAHESDTDTASCSECHDDELTTEHFMRTDEGGSPLTCASCHDSSDAGVIAAIGAGDSACSACHASADHESLHATTVAPECASCHAATSLTTLHIRAGSALTCDSCHDSTDPEVVAAIAADELACSACHTEQGTDYHVDFPAKHTYSAMDPSCIGAGCHASTLVEAHSAFVGAGKRYPQYADTCALCHRNEDPQRVPAGATSACASCHTETHGDIGVIHTATPAPAGMSILGTDFGSHACSECHTSAVLTDLHGGASSCGTCHPTPASTATPWSKGCVQGGCHTLGSSAPQHGALDTAHVTTPKTCTATAGCHSGGTNIAAIHSQQGCDACHGAGVTPSAECATCHDLGAPHGDDRAIHDSSVSDGVVRMFDDHDGYGALDYGIECSWCHGTANLIDVHDNQCSTCHGGPRGTFTTWNGTCQQGSCHPSYHDEAPGGHQDAYDYNDCEAECHNSDWGVPAENCGACHTLVDSAAPVTTSDALASYIGPAAVHLGSSDPFPASGVAQTYYTVDGGATAQGTTVNVAAPSAGTQQHTVTFWSVDNEGHIETQRNTSFAIVADTTPPSTTSNAESSYVGPSTIRLTATDNGTLGVKATYYRVDGGAPVSGSVVAVPQPESGVEAHTVEFWSVDWSNNEEAHTTVSFENSVDSVPPVTTVTGADTWLKFYRAFITLNAVDVGDAGVVASYAILDGNFLGGPSTGSLYTNSASIYLEDGWHTLEYWSVDAVGNTEVHNMLNFGIDWHGPSLSTDAKSTYTGTATVKITATDPHAGVKEIRYRLDGGAMQYGDTVVVPPPASGNVYHNLQYWAEDNAGNVSSNATGFRVYAPTDTTPPSGTMSVNNGAAYATAGAATVNSAMTDSASGMSQMRIDPGTGTFGGWVAYNATYSITLPVGDGTKTVRAEYRDVAGNVASRSDAIVLDASAPSGTMSVNNGAAETQSLVATVDSAMTDSVSGVHQMRIDPGTGTYGSWIAYAASSPITLPSGNGIKTVRVEYRDNAGNTATRTDTIVLSIDTMPPVTTSTAISGQAYTGDQTFMLSGTDSGSGVASTWYKLDAGAWTQGTIVLVGAPASGAVSHTLSWYSIDFADNQEAVQSVTFTVQPPLAGGSATFNFTGADQLFVVPAGVTQLAIDLYGGEGGWFDGQPGGAGGGLEAMVPVTPGQVLTVRVGGCPADDSQYGAWPNGGNPSHGGAGGGSTSILSGATIWLEAGAGGGGDHNGSDGGPGGAQGWLPGGGQFGEDADGAAGGGGWNGGAGYGSHDGGGDGGTSYIAVGTGTLSEGVNLGDGWATITW